MGRVSESRVRWEPDRAGGKNGSGVSVLKTSRNGRLVHVMNSGVFLIQEENWGGTTKVNLSSPARRGVFILPKNQWAGREAFGKRRRKFDPSPPERGYQPKANGCGLSLEIGLQ